MKNARTRELAYSEKSQDSRLAGDGFFLRVDQSRMRILLSRDSDGNHKTPRIKYMKAEVEEAKTMEIKLKIEV